MEGNGYPRAAVSLVLAMIAVSGYALWVWLVFTDRWAPVNLISYPVSLMLPLAVGVAALGHARRSVALIAPGAQCRRLAVAAALIGYVTFVPMALYAVLMLVFYTVNPGD